MKKLLWWYFTSIPLMIIFSIIYKHFHGQEPTMWYALFQFNILFSFLASTAYAIIKRKEVFASRTLRTLILIEWGTAILWGVFLSIVV